MKVVVLGGAGVAGRHVVEALRRNGADAVPASRRNGVDLATGAGLREALAGACLLHRLGTASTAGGGTGRRGAARRRFDRRS